MADIPEDCLSLILSLLPPQDSLRLTTVSRSWAQAVASNTTWRNLIGRAQILLFGFPEFDEFSHFQSQFSNEFRFFYEKDNDFCLRNIQSSSSSRKKSQIYFQDGSQWISQKNVSIFNSCFFGSHSSPPSHKQEIQKDSNSLPKENSSSSLSLFWKPDIFWLLVRHLSLNGFFFDKSRRRLSLLLHSGNLEISFSLPLSSHTLDFNAQNGLLSSLNVNRTTTVSHSDEPKYQKMGVLRLASFGRISHLCAGNWFQMGCKITCNLQSGKYRISWRLARAPQTRKQPGLKVSWNAAEGDSNSTAESMISISGKRTMFRKFEISMAAVKEFPEWSEIVMGEMEVEENEGIGWEKSRNDGGIENFLSFRMLEREGFSEGESGIRAKCNSLLCNHQALSYRWFDINIEAKLVETKRKHGLFVDALVITQLQ